MPLLFASELLHKGLWYPTILGVLEGLRAPRPRVWGGPRAMEAPMASTGNKKTTDVIDAIVSDF